MQSSFGSPVGYASRFNGNHRGVQKPKQDVLPRHHVPLRQIDSSYQRPSHHDDRANQGHVVYRPRKRRLRRQLECFAFRPTKPLRLLECCHSVIRNLRNEQRTSKQLGGAPECSSCLDVHLSKKVRSGIAANLEPQWFTVFSGLPSLLLIAARAHASACAEQPRPGVRPVQGCEVASRTGHQG